MRSVVVLSAQARDRAEVLAAGLEERYEVKFLGGDLDAGAISDPEEIVAECVASRPSAVVGTKDRSALLASVCTARLGLPGPTPDAVLACQHKLRARELQTAVAPVATPRFAALSAGEPPFPPPFFVKPVVGRLSQGARRIERLADLPRAEQDRGRGRIPLPLQAAAQAQPQADAYLEGYRRIAELAGLDVHGLDGLLAEELVTGEEVTLEGYAFGGAVTVVGITDSVKYPGTSSFERFDYPSRLSGPRCDELAGVAEHLVPALGFDNGFFNIEFAVPSTGPAKLIEINARIASQFAPLQRLVHGRSTYDALFALAAGDDPSWQPGAPAGAAVSYVVRVFEDALVEAVPEPSQDVEILVSPGKRLSEHIPNDAFSFRLAIVYGAGATHDEALARCKEKAARLRFRLTPA